MGGAQRAHAVHPPPPWRGRRVWGAASASSTPSTGPAGRPGAGQPVGQGACPSWGGERVRQDGLERPGGWRSGVALSVKRGSVARSGCPISCASLRNCPSLPMARNTSQGRVGKLSYGAMLECALPTPLGRLAAEQVVRRRDGCSRQAPCRNRAASCPRTAHWPERWRSCKAIRMPTTEVQPGGQVHHRRAPCAAAPRSGEPLTVISPTMPLHHRVVPPAARPMARPRRSRIRGSGSGAETGADSVS